MPKFKSPEHEANWRAAMAKRGKKTPVKSDAPKPENGEFDAVLERLVTERERAHAQFEQFDQAVKALTALQLQKPA